MMANRFRTEARTCPRRGPSGPHDPDN